MDQKFLKIRSIEAPTPESSLEPPSYIVDPIFSNFPSLISKYVVSLPF